MFKDLPKKKRKILVKKIGGRIRERTIFHIIWSVSYVGI